jgi:hypothetical protein
LMEKIYNLIYKKNKYDQKWSPFYTKFETYLNDSQNY